MKKKSVTGHVAKTRVTVSWAERLRDHENKIEEYLQNRLIRGCNPETTIRGDRSVLLSTFRKIRVKDPTHPDGHRQLVFWEWLDPEKGPYYTSLISILMLEENKAIATRRGYTGCLRDFSNYVLLRPHVPGCGGTRFTDKYGPMTQTITKYDVVIHSQDRPVKKRYALATPLLNDLYEFLRRKYLPHYSVPHLAARNFLAIVLQAEVGGRTSEILEIRLSGGESDIDWTKQRVRLFGKGAKFSGKRIRWVPLSAYAVEVLKKFERVFKPMFPSTSASDYLFLNRDGGRLSRWRFWKIFRELVDIATAAGVEIPPDLRPHDLRRTSATRELQKNPVAYRKVLKNHGHTFPSSAAPYLIATDEDVEEEQNDLIDIFVDPQITFRRKK